MCACLCVAVYVHALASQVWASVWATWFTFEMPFGASIRYAFLHTHMRAFGGLWAFANAPSALGLDAPPCALSLSAAIVESESPHMHAYVLPMISRKAVCTRNLPWCMPVCDL